MTYSYGMLQEVPSHHVINAHWEGVKICNRALPWSPTYYCMCPVLYWYPLLVPLSHQRPNATAKGMFTQRFYAVSFVKIVLWASYPRKKIAA